MSDLHVGDPFSKWRDAMNILQHHGSKMNVIVFAGDTYDLKALNAATTPGSHQRILNEIEFFKQSLEDSGLLDKTVFIQGNHDPSLPRRMYVKLATLAGRVFILHGHNLGAERIAKRSNWGGSTGERIKKKLVEGCEFEWAPQLRPEDWLFMGHSHVSYFVTEAKVVGLGCWYGSYSNPSVGSYLVINDQPDNNPSSLKTLYILKRYNGISNEDVFTAEQDEENPEF